MIKYFCLCRFILDDIFILYKYIHALILFLAACFTYSRKFQKYPKTTIKIDIKPISKKSLKMMCLYFN